MSGADLDVNVAKANVTEQMKLCGWFIKIVLPTIYHCKDGELGHYHIPRAEKDFINFVSDKQLKNIGLFILVLC